MPTYQYVCTECGTPLEAVQSFKDPALTECPTCSGRLRKVFSAVGVVFKGSGFYKNDSRSTSTSATTAAPAAAGAAASGSSSSSSSSEGGGSTAPASKPAESKPAAKSDSKSTSSATT